MRLVRDMRAIGDSLAELRSTDAVEEEKASRELAESALRFSRHTKETVDDKLSFSATLMRAGEVQAATRLIAELEGDVREEEVALVEAINEVQAARSLRREKITRLRVAHLLVTAILGTGLMGFSAAGIAVAGMFAERAAAPKPARVDAELSSSASDHLAGMLASGGKTVRRIHIGGRVIALNREQREVLRTLRSGAGSAALLEAFLASLPKDVVESVRTMLVFAAAAIQEAFAGSVESLPAGDAATGASGTSKPTKGGSTGDVDDPDTDTPPDDGPDDDDDVDDVDGTGLNLNMNGLPL